MKINIEAPVGPILTQIVVGGDAAPFFGTSQEDIPTGKLSRLTASNNAN